jgi:hypothetical protein
MPAGMAYIEDRSRPPQLSTPWVPAELSAGARSDHTPACRLPEAHGDKRQLTAWRSQQGHALIGAARTLLPSSHLRPAARNRCTGAQRRNRVVSYGRTDHAWQARGQVRTEVADRVRADREQTCLRPHVRIQAMKASTRPV